MNVVVRDARVDGRRRDLRVEGCEAVVLDGERLPTGGRGSAPDLVVDAAGGACLPGLHDHHVHLLAAAAAAASVDVAGAADAAALAGLLRPPGAGWVRALGYHESIAGPLDRRALDRLTGDRPVRVQHRSGALWMLNSAALREVAGALDDSADVERDRDGAPTGRLWRYDARLRPALPAMAPDLRALGDRLLRLGVTGATDATPDLAPDAVDLLVGARADGRLPQRLLLMGAPDGWAPPPGSGVGAGPAKLLLRDHDLPDVAEIAAWIDARHRHGRPVAVHCVTADALALVVAALDLVGPLPGDRLEHAAVVPDGLRGDLVRLGLRVVTQPDFLRTRGEEYRREVPPDELGFLYPFASLRDAGVPVAASSDAPFGDLDPWRVVRSAARRETYAGTVLGRAERVDAAVALAGYLAPPDRPGDPPRALRTGGPGDLCLLGVPLAEALAAPDAAAAVRLTVVGGRVVALG
ncbi:amidohydrolase family protein [Nocardioides sp. YIM 152588]|uniref:amidohydrolase family protein n=1 Tax=Nocardioides sp. YIM 152588 TaxID=3158259 RepID=UPI0032E37CB7